MVMASGGESGLERVPDLHRGVATAEAEIANALIPNESCGSVRERKLKEFFIANTGRCQISHVFDGHLRTCRFD